MIVFKPDQLKNLDLNKPLTLAADEGVYLMTGFGEIAYAEGLNPNTDDWYDLKVDEVGGDDFGERMDPIKDLDPTKELYVKITKKYIKFSQKE